MIKTQIIKHSSKPIAVIMDYKEYKRLKKISNDMLDYDNAIEAKESTEKWTSHEELKKELDL